MIRQKLEKPKTVEEAREQYTHLDVYLEEWKKKKELPQYEYEPTKALGRLPSPNIIYPVGGPIYIHIYKDDDRRTQYHIVEPRLSERQEKLYQEILSKLIELAHSVEVPHDLTQIDKVLLELFDRAVTTTDQTGATVKQRLLNISHPKIKLEPNDYELIKYYLIRDRVGYSRLEPLFYDPFLEDIHCTGTGHIQAIHKIFDMIHTNIGFKDDIELNKFVIEMSERVERPTSDAYPIVDAMMPDGSRVNFIYSRDVSLEGSSFTIRKFAEVPVSITQVVNWGTMSAEVGAYLWLALENGMNTFVCGETASGKTTSLNAAAAFIKPDDKVYTVENTPEVTMPHSCWQHLLCREAGKATDVTYTDLLIASLRSRPNYIIVGEIRGVEGSIAFQAMQTGHPVMSTFHAGNVTTMIQRLTGDPINVPIAFIDNLNIAIIQMAVMRKGKFLRRILSVTELERYYEPENKVVTREVFSWDPTNDKHVFKGLYNSYILENKIAFMQGYKDTRKIYDEMATRVKIIEKMIELKIFNYYEVWEIIKKYHYGGLSALPFEIEQ